MMTKADHIAYWKMEAADDWVDAQDFAQTGKRVWALFAAHLSIEKLSKALWIQANVANTPPFIHNIRILLSATSFMLTPAQQAFVAQLNAFQLEGRYRDYRNSLKTRATAAFTATILTETATLRQCLLEMLP